MSRFDEVQKICASRGIIFPTAEIYPNNIAGFYDYGNVGSLLKRKFIEYWREFFIKSSPFTMLELDGSVILPEDVFIASGHLKGFVDPIVQCSRCKTVFRADHIIEESLHEFVEGKTIDELNDIITRRGLKCPKCKGHPEKARIFNLMMKTEISPTGGQTGYLRPETAQNIFSNFQRIYKTSRAKLPFGVYQIGHSFRNEISPRQFIIRTREFSQCEIELFYDPDNEECPIEEELEREIMFLDRDSQSSGKEAERIKIKDLVQRKMVPNNWIAYYLGKVFEFYRTLGIPENCIRIRQLLPEETPHYSSGNYDLEVKFDFGWKEIVSNSCRNDYDISHHMQQSGEDLSVLTEDGRKIVPHVTEPSFGLDRTIMCILYHSFREDGKRGWNWFSFPAKLSPFTAGVFPLVSRDGLPEKAREVYEMLKKDFDIFYDEKGSIGKRYARADEIGTLFGITIDNQTMEDNTVTLRNRDTAEQVRVKITELPSCLINEMRK